MESAYRVSAMTELQSLVTAITDDLGDPDSWQAPVEFLDSLALCALNSVYTLRATSASAIRVLNRYRLWPPVLVLPLDERRCGQRDQARCDGSALHHARRRTRSQIIT